MDDNVIATHLENLDRRLAAVEQILPSLATKEDLKSFATKEELRREIREEGERSRRYMDILTESLREDIHLIAAHVAAADQKRINPKDAGT